MKYFINIYDNFLHSLSNTELKNIIIQKGIFSSIYTTASTEFFDNFSNLDNLFTYQKNIPLELLNTSTMVLSFITIYFYIKNESLIDKKFSKFEEYNHSKKITNYLFLIFIFLFVRNIDKVY